MFTTAGISVEDYVVTLLREAGWSEEQIKEIIETGVFKTDPS